MPSTQQAPQEPVTRGERAGRDVRARRPPALGFLLRLDTARRVARIVSLLVLDYAAIFAAILTALCLKAALLDAWDFRASLAEAQATVSFA